MLDDENLKDIPLDKKIKARLFMTDHDKKDDWFKKGEYLEKRRQEAVLAMASAEQKAVKAEEEKKIKEKELAQKRLEELQIKKKLADEEKIRKEREAQLIEEKKQAEIKHQEIDKIINSKKIIEEIAKKESPELSSIRTFRQDATSTVINEKLSAAKMIAQEANNRKKESVVNTNWKKNLIIFLSSCILITVGGSIIYFAYNLRKEKSQVNPNNSIKSIIFSDEHKEIDITGKKPEEVTSLIGDQIKSSPADREKVENIYFTRINKIWNGKDWEEKKEILDFKSLVASSTLQVSNDLTRFLEDEFMLGIYYTNQISPFYVLRTKYYSNAASALLNDENRIIYNLYAPFLDSADVEILRTVGFKDRTIKNVDIRFIENEKNQTILLYSFLDKNTLLIAENEDIFLKILNSYQTPKATKS